MPRPAFSKDYRLYGDWLKNANKNSPYVKSIIKKHKLFPDRSLEFLRELKISDIQLSKLPAKLLSSKKMQERRAALQIIHTMQPGKNYKGMSLRNALKFHNSDPSNIKMSEKKVKEHLGDVLTKEKRRFSIKPNGKLETTHNIFSEGERREITISTQKDRDLIKEYYRDIWKMENNRLTPSEFSKKWKGKQIKDANGKKWIFEHRRGVIEEIKEREIVNYVASYAR